MELRCEHFVNDILPAVRGMIARCLLEDHGLTQRQVALKLDMTQPAISQYKNELRGKQARKIESSEEITRKIDELAEAVARGSIDKEDYSEGICDICKGLRKFHLYLKVVTVANFRKYILLPHQTASS